MQLADGSFCYEMVAGEGVPRGRSLRYTLMVLLGCLRADRARLRHGLDTSRLKAVVLDELESSQLGPGDMGLCLWADARSEAEATERILDGLEGRITGRHLFARLDGIELSWILIGLASTAAIRTSPRVERLLSIALGEQLERAQTPSGLLMHRGTGWRRRLPNFATQIYGVLSLAICAGTRENEVALNAACGAADAILRLQRSDAGWPWMFDSRRGSVVEPYELYSVHQDAMAPMALFELSSASGEGRYRDAALRGLDWIWGGNDLGCDMLDVRADGAGDLYRSIRRRRPLDRVVLYANALGSVAGRPPLSSFRGPLEVNRNDRPYHLGWILEAWSDTVGSAGGRCL
jgi:hypothetical protein